MVQPLAAAASELRAEVSALGDVALIVVDSLVPAGRSTGSDRPWHDAAADVFAVLRTFAPAGQLVIGHPNKADVDRPGQPTMPYGSYFNVALARSVWEWRRTDGAPDEILAGAYHRKANTTAIHRPMGFRFAFEPDPEHVDRVTVDSYDLMREPELLARAGLRDQIIGALRTRAFSVQDLAGELGKSQDVVRRTLNRMAERRLVVKLSDGAWGLQEG
jgi:hypothetical protein